MMGAFRSGPPLSQGADKSRFQGGLPPDPMNERDRENHSGDNLLKEICFFNPKRRSRRDAAFVPLFPLGPKLRARACWMIRSDVSI
jgi:hypothetical protein